MSFTQIESFYYYLRDFFKGKNEVPLHSTVIPFASSTISLDKPINDRITIKNIRIDANLKVGESVLVEIYDIKTKSWDRRILRNTQSFDVLTNHIKFTGVFTDVRYGYFSIVYTGEHIDMGTIGINEEPKNVLDAVGVIGKGALSIERRSIISNNGDTPGWSTYATGVFRSGKFFTSHCLGFINTIDVYCYNNGGTERTITVWISPNPDLGYIATATITVEPYGEAKWRSALFNRMWLSDKLFIYIKISHNDVRYGYESGLTKNDDAWGSVNSGESFTSGSTIRYWFRAVMRGQEEGYLNIGGTINNIPIPNTSTLPEVEVVEVNGGFTKTIFTVEGSGQIDFMYLRFYRTLGSITYGSIKIRFTVDGNLFERGLGVFIGGIDETVNTPTAINCTKCALGSGEVDIILWFNKPMNFQRKFLCEVKNGNPVSNNISVVCLYQASVVR